ncbi:hypothetical protein ACK1KB_06940 [Chryseobacterium sp. TY3]
MKLWFSIFYSSLILLCSSQSALLQLDYAINQDFYELHCENKDQPELDCHGKCQMSQTENPNIANSQLLKICFDYSFIGPKIINFEENFSFTLQNRDVNIFQNQIYISPSFEIAEEPPTV